MNSEPILFKGAKVFDPLCLCFRNLDFVVQSQKIVETGTLSHLGYSTVNLKGYWVLPGFVDSHCHILGVGQKEDVCNLEKFDDIHKMFEHIKHSLRSLSSPYVFRGWDETKLGIVPSRDLIRKFLGDVEILLIRRCGHVALISEALEKKHGLHTKNGMVSEDQLSDLLQKIPHSLESLKIYLKKGCERALKHGVTTIHSDDLHRTNVVRLITILRAQRKLRIQEELALKTPEEVCKLRKLFGFYSPHLAIPGIKIYLDGSLGGRTAYLEEEYSDEPGNRGVLNHTCKDLERFLNVCAANGLTLSIHVIGDGALNAVLKTIYRVHRIPSIKLIHLQITKPEHIIKLKKLRVNITVQPGFWKSDREMARSRIGDRMKYAYRFRDMYLKMLKVGFSSDAPVETIDPRYGIEAAMELGFEWEEAVALYTWGSAQLSSIPVFRNTGRIAKGYYADFLIYDSDPRKMCVPASVFVGGREVYPGR